jgi:carboxyl-terminal processing protease
VTSFNFRRITGVLFIALAVGFGYLAGLLTPSLALPVRSADVSSTTLVDEAWQLVDDHFIGTIPSTQTRVYAAIRGMLTTLDDPYTVLVEPPAAKLETDQLRGSFGGIGADLRRDAEGRTLLSPYPDGPAARAGAADGDQLGAIDGEAVLPEQRIDEVEARLRGEVGSMVRLSLVRMGQAIDVQVDRAEIVPPSTTWRMIDGVPTIGYISIRLFTDRTVDEIRKAADDLRRRGMRQIILDLRDNGGGLLQSAVDVAGQFVDGVILIEAHRDGSEQPFSAPADGAARDMPLVILVNNSTASASEIVAGALRDHRQAPLIGERTYGKGSVQNVYPLVDGSSLHVTTALWFTPNRARLDGQGLLPDIEVKRSADDRAAGRDPVLDRAVTYLQSLP